MFDLLPAEKATPPLADLPEWREAEKLAYEKEALGFYITGHPLRQYQDQIKRLASFDTQKCAEALDKSEVGLCGVVTSLKEILTRKGARMAFITLEDLAGSLEVVVFSDVYEKCATILKSDTPIYVKGNVDHNEDSVKILAREILSLEQLKLQKTREVHLRIRKELMSSEAFLELKRLLAKYPGRLPAYLHLIESGKQDTILALPPDFEIGLSEDFIFEVEKLLGTSALMLT